MSDSAGLTRVERRVAFVIAGDTPAGRSVAKALAAAGDNVVVCYRSDHAAAAETRRAIEALGRACLTMPADVSMESECIRVVGRTVHRFGALDVLALVPTIWTVGETVLDVAPEELDEMVRTPLLLCRAALPYLTHVILVTNSVGECFFNALSHAIEKRGIQVTTLNAQWFLP